MLQRARSRRTAPIVGSRPGRRTTDISRLPRLQSTEPLRAASALHTYRGDRLKVDRNGPRGILFDTECVQLDLSLSASVPVESDDNDARRGMPDLDPTAEIGPVLKYFLTEEDAPLSNRLELPVRAVIATDFSSLEYVGWFVLPSLWVEVKDAIGGWNLSLGVGPIFADANYHDYYCGVAPGCSA